MSAPPFNRWPDNWRRDPGFWFLFELYKWHYGMTRASEISLGYDGATNQDRRAWRQLLGLAR